MPDFTPADEHFQTWWRLFLFSDPDDLLVYAGQATHWVLSMAVQRKLGAVPGSSE